MRFELPLEFAAKPTAEMPNCSSGPGSATPMRGKSLTCRKAEP
jgi:hypothetical protein